MVYFLFGIGMLAAIALTGLISGSETAITGASKAYLYHLAKKGDGRAKQVLALQENIGTSIGAILMLNQIVLYLIPIGSTLFAIKYLTAGEGAILQVVLAVVLVIYAEMFPKMLALRFTTQFALFIAPIALRTVRVLKPIISVLEFCAQFTLRIIGVNVEDNNAADQAEEELRGAIEMHVPEEDAEDVQKKSMLNNILDLEEIPVSHTMIHRKNMFTMNVDMPMEQIADMLTTCAFTRVPVWKDNPENIIGILKTKTFFRAMQMQHGDLSNIKINHLISPPWFIPETTHLLDQLQSFQKKREHFALVVDEYGDLMGCITLEDILEEIVGEIADEYDTITNGVSVQADGLIIADGATPIRDLNRQFSLNIPEEEAATIAGYVMHEVRKIPDVGQTYVLSGIKIEILRRQGNQIGLVRLTLPSEVSSEFVE